MKAASVSSPRDAASSWLHRYRPDDTAAVRLFCFPHAGGSASAYLPLARALAPAVEAVPVQYPGRQERRGEPFLESVDEVVDALEPVLRGCADRPYALFGHSLGATLAYELARRLGRGERPPVRLFVSGRRSPSLPRRDMSHLRDDATLLAEVARMQGCDPRLLEDDELRDMMLPPLRNDARMADGYRHRPGPPLTVPLTVLTGDDDPHVTVDDARAWQDVAGSAPVDLHVLSGGHFYLNDHTDAVCRIVEEALGHAR